MRYRLMACVVTGATVAAAASPVTLQVNSAQSNVSVTLCMSVTSLQCTTDTSTVAGTVVGSFDCITAPTELTLHDFNLQLTQPIVLNLSWGFAGQFNSTATGVQINYATPGTPMPPTPLTSGAFTYANIPAVADGSLAYNATVLVCVGFTAAGQPCNATIDLSTLVLNPITLSGSTAIMGRDVSATLNVNVSGPLDPANPGLGNLAIVGTIQATGVVPLPSVETFTNVLLGIIQDGDLVCECDINSDGQTNAIDIQPYVNALLAP